MTELALIEGGILDLIFQNKENGYTVLRLVTDDGEVVTAVGCMPCAAPGERISASGTWKTHPQHGEQFEVQSAERYMPHTEDEIISYLASGIIKGVGSATAERLVENKQDSSIAQTSQSSSSTMPSAMPVRTVCSSGTAFKISSRNISISGR